MALVLIAGILAISVCAAYVSGQSERNQAENTSKGILRIVQQALP